MKPNKARIKKWISALRSGKFQQATNTLRNTDNGVAYCCLGVACELYRRSTKSGSWTDDPNASGTEDFAFRHSPRAKLAIGLPPDKVLRWFGVKLDVSPSVIASVMHDHPDIARDLATLNDDGATFEQIADMLEAQYLK